MSSNNTPIASVVRPGPSPEGPPGWETERIRKEQAAADHRDADDAGKHQRSGSGGGGMSGLKDKVHKIGEKLSLVEPKDPSLQTAAQQQNASTGPEIAPKEN